MTLPDMVNLIGQTQPEFLEKPDARAVQRCLTLLGFPTLMSGGIGIDGAMGPGTLRGLDMFRLEEPVTGGDIGTLYRRAVQCPSFGAQETIGLLEANRRFTASQIMSRFFQRIDQAAKALQVAPEMIAAIMAVETGGVPAFRFESHVYQRMGGEPRERRIKSTSWGLFQVMGFNIQDSEIRPFDTIFSFIYFTDFLKKSPRILDAMRRNDWAGIAKGYNGAGFRQNRYDEKLQKAYEGAKNG